MALLAPLPLRLLRLLGWALGRFLFMLARARRHIVLTNLRLCFPELNESQRKALAQQHFVCFSQSVLDRAWLWQRSRSVLRSRLHIVGDTSVLLGTTPVVVFGPHFIGLDAAGIALTERFPLSYLSIFTPQRSKTVEAWIQSGRNRFGNMHSVSRYENQKNLLRKLRQGSRLFLLPDLDFGLRDSVFVPFFGTNAATLTSLGRFAELGGARVISVFAEMVPDGYLIHVHNDWTDFPGPSALHNALRMNQTLERYVRTMPAQYYWLHKRFKTRPEGEASVYGP